MNKDILKQLRKQANDFQIIKGWKVRVTSSSCTIQ
jgi:hypothetical protein